MQADGPAPAQASGSAHVSRAADSLFARHIEIEPPDIDESGVVYTPRIAHFVVETVEAWFVERLSMVLHANGRHMVFASLSCTFLSPMRPLDGMEIRVALRRIGRSSLGFEIVGLRQSDDRLCWMAETVCVFIEPQSFRSRMIPPELRQVLRAEADLSIRHPFADRTMGS